MTNSSLIHLILLIKLIKIGKTWLLLTTERQKKEEKKDAEIQNEKNNSKTDLSRWWSSTHFAIHSPRLNVLNRRIILRTNPSSVKIHPCTSHWYSSQNNVWWHIRAPVTSIPLRTVSWSIRAAVTGIPHRTRCDDTSVQQSLEFLSEHTVMIHPCSSHWCSSQSTLSSSICAAVTGIPPEHAVMIHPCSSHRSSSQNRVSWSIRAAVTGTPPEHAVMIHPCSSHWYSSRTRCHDPSVQQSLVLLSEQAAMVHPHSSHRSSSQNRVSWRIHYYNSLSSKDVMIHLCVSSCHTSGFIIYLCTSHDPAMHLLLLHLPHRARVS